MKLNQIQFRFNSTNDSHSAKHNQFPSGILWFFFCLTSIRIHLHRPLLLLLLHFIKNNNIRSSENDAEWEYSIKRSSGERIQIALFDWHTIDSLLINFGENSNIDMLTMLIIIVIAIAIPIHILGTVNDAHNTHIFTIMHTTCSYTHIYLYI